MGKRRTKHLKELGHEVIGWDITHKTKMPIVPDCDGVVISTPPDHHEEYFCNISLPTFVEASVIPYKPQGNIFPSCTMRFHPTVEYLRKHIKETKPLAFIYHVGNHIEDWHPNEDYRTKYFAKYVTGGAKEIVAYELCWLVDVFGPIVMSLIIGEKLSKLQMEADDYYRGLLEFASDMVGTLIVDTVSRPRVRELKIIYDGNTESYDMGDVDWEDCYRREIKAWIDIFGGSEWPYSVEEDLNILHEINMGEDDE